MKEDLSFGSKLLLKEMRNFLNDEMFVLRETLDSKILKDRSLIIMAMIGSLLGTGNAILRLMEYNQHFYNDGVMLARGFFERITNVCFLLVCDEETFEKCMKHSIYKKYAHGKNNEKTIRDKNNNILMKIGLKQSHIEDMKNNPFAKEAIDLFEKEKGQKQNFPIPKIEQRLGVLTEQSKGLNTSLFLAYQQAYYSDASEALHGSFYGSLFQILNINTREKDKMEEEVDKNTTLLLWQTGELFNQLIILLNEKIDITEYYEKSLGNSRLALEKMEKAMANN